MPIPDRAPSAFACWFLIESEMTVPNSNHSCFLIRPLVAWKPWSVLIWWMMTSSVMGAGSNWHTNGGACGTGAQPRSSSAVISLFKRTFPLPKWPFYILRFLHIYYYVSTYTCYIRIWEGPLRSPHPKGRGCLGCNLCFCFLFSVCSQIWYLGSWSLDEMTVWLANMIAELASVYF